jgi:hypothetical protein
VVPEYDYAKPTIADAEFIAHSRIDVVELANRLNEATMRLKEAAQIIHDEGLIDDVEYDDELKYIASLERPLEQK